MFTGPHNVQPAAVRLGGESSPSGRALRASHRRAIAVLALLQLAWPLAAGAQTLEPSARLMGFADFSYLHSDRPEATGFRQGQLVGHLVSELGERLGLFGEVSATGTSTGYRVEVERLILRYSFRDALKLSAGRFHTPIAYWNTAYHHGHWLQTSITRPEMIRGGGRFLPVHYVGVMAEGTVAPGPGLSYLAGIGNGRASDLVRAGDQGEPENRPAYNAGIHFRPGRLPGVQFGGALLLDGPTTADGTRVDERITTLHFALDRYSTELLAELAWVGRTSEAAASSQTGDGWYVQAGYRPAVAGRRLKPYMRAEAVTVDVGDPIQPDGMHYRRLLGGVRYDFTTLAALKLEYQRERSFNDRFRVLVIEVAYTFPGASGEHVAVGHHE